MREVEYEPRSLREVLVELKDSSELAVDLAYSALLFENRELASEVLDLEDRVDYLRYHARIALMLAAKRADGAERLVGIFQVVESPVAATSAAADIAHVLLDDVGLPAAFAAEFPDADEDLLRVQIAQGTDLTGRSLEELALDVEDGVRVIAIRHGEGGSYDPPGDMRIEPDDVLVVNGPQRGEPRLRELAEGTR